MIFFIITNLITLLILIILIKRYVDHRRDEVALQKLLSGANVGYYKYRYRDGVVLAANRGFYKIFELDEKGEDIVGRSMSELLIYVEDQKSVRKKLRHHEGIKHFEYHFKTLTGKDKWVLHNSRYLRDIISGEEAIEALVEDITEEKISYEKMKESQERYEKLFKSSGDMVIIYSFNDSIIEEANPVTEVLTGFAGEELTGRLVQEIIHPSHRKGLETAHQDLLFRGMTTLETVLVCKNGSYKEVILTLSVVDIEGAKIVIAVAKDISEMVKEQEEQERRKKELEDFRAASLKREERVRDMRLELERANQQIRLLKEKK